LLSMSLFVHQTDEFLMCEWFSFFLFNGILPYSCNILFELDFYNIVVIFFYLFFIYL
jgi:hypothetical protein